MPLEGAKGFPLEMSFATVTLLMQDNVCWLQGVGLLFLSYLKPPAFHVSSCIQGHTVGYGEQRCVSYGSLSLLRRQAPL